VDDLAVAHPDHAEGGVLLKGMFASLAGSTDPALHERVFTVVADGLRPRG
jgi:hypothetical protein